MKDLAGGDVAIAVVNLGDSEGAYAAALDDYDALDSAVTYTARELIGLTDAGALSASSLLSGTIAPHGTVVFRLSAR